MRATQGGEEGVMGMKPRQTKVLGIGAALQDILAPVSDVFLQNYVQGRKGGMELVNAATAHELFKALRETPASVPGGSVTNTIKGLAKLDMPTRMLGKIGCDTLGASYVQALRQINVDTSVFKFSDTEPTGSCLCLVTPDAERTMRTCLGASATLTPGEVTLADFAGCTHACIEGYMIYNQPVLRHCLELARQADCVVAFDLSSPEVAGGFKLDLAELLANHVDILFANETEAAEFTGCKDEREALRSLSQYCETVAIKLGARGSLIFHKGEVTEIAPRLVKAVDTTGAGDLWAAGFLYGHLLGWPIEQSGRLASVTAAAVVQQVGATIPDDVWTEIRLEFLI
jgi:sugar/nucleoside kinase (ribokinase family)